MKHIASLFLVLVAGIAIGAWGVPVLRAQPAGEGAYVVAEMHVTNPAQFMEYMRREPAAIAAYHGRLLARALPDMREGVPADGMVSLTAFASAQDANAWFNSPGYRALLPLQEEAATARVYILSGVH